MLLPVCLDPIQAWTRLKKSHWAWSPHDSFLSLFSLPATSFLHSLPLSDHSQSIATPLVTLLPGHMTAEFKPRGHGLAWGPMTARGYLSGTDSPIFAAVQQYPHTQPHTHIHTHHPLPKLASPPLNHASGTCEEDQSARQSINTGSSWQNTQTLTN